jgi:hypothetical protein
MEGKTINSKATYRTILLLLFALALTGRLHGQSANDYFVGSAQLYVNGETDKAKNYVAQGLSVFPDDKKLVALKKAMEEENKDKKNQNKQDQNKDQQQKQDKKEDQQKQDQQRISREDAQRLLDALANDEKKVQEKVKMDKAAKARVKTVINW